MQLTAAGTQQANVYRLNLSLTHTLPHFFHPPPLIDLPQAGARLCKALGPEFLPYLPTVMPQLLTAAKLEPELKVSQPQH